MKKNILVSVVLVIFSAVIFLGGFILGISFEKKDLLLDNFLQVPQSFNKSNAFGNSELSSQVSTSSIEIKAIQKAIDFITANSLNKKTAKELTSAAIKGMLSSLEDKYADYFSPEQYKQIIESYSGTMSGIGVIVTLNDKNEVLIISVIENTPAFNAGLLEGDIITAVDGISIKEKSLDEVVSMIKGEENTQVSLTIFRQSENKNYNFTIIRKRFYVPNFSISKIEQNILYIQYIDFQEEGAVKLGEKIQSILDNANKTEKTESLSSNYNNGYIKGIIIDLRNNLGGTLNDAVMFCDLFLDKGLIVTVKGRTNNKDIVEEYKAKPGGYTNIPLVVLINGYSASAAELAAGALKDLNRALLIGEKSFGKGTVQVLNDLPDGSGIKFTTAKYFLPSGTSIDGVGITPDIVVALTKDDKEDVQLKRAIEEIKILIDNWDKN